MNTPSYLTASPELPPRRTSVLFPVLSFSIANFRGILRNWVVIAITLFTPLLLLLLFWATSMASPQTDGSKVNLLAFMFPGIVAFTVIQAGGPHAITIVNWREQGIFRRLACTPVPLWQLVLGRALAQLALSLLQGALMIVVGLALTGASIAWDSLLLSFGVLAVASACFIALGSVIAGLFRNALLTNAVYMFILIPMMFLGDFLMPTGVLPSALQTVGRLLPPAMVTALTRPLLTTGTLPLDFWTPVIGLVIYTVGFVLLSIKLFRWE